jgi:hypothetical protein
MLQRGQKRRAPAAPLRRSERLRAAKAPREGEEAATKFTDADSKDEDQNNDNNGDKGKDNSGGDVEEEDLGAFWNWSLMWEFIGGKTAIQCLPPHVRQIVMCFASHSEEEGKIVRWDQMTALRGEFGLSNLAYNDCWDKLSTQIDTQLRIISLTGRLLRSWVGTFSKLDDGRQQLARLATFPYIVISSSKLGPFVADEGNLLLPRSCTMAHWQRFMEERSLRLAKRDSLKHQNESKQTDGYVASSISALRGWLGFRHIYVDDVYVEPCQVPWARQALVGWWMRLNNDPSLLKTADGEDVLAGMRFHSLHLRWSDSVKSKAAIPILYDDSRMEVWSNSCRIEDVICNLALHKQTASEIYDKQMWLYDRLGVLRDVLYSQCGKLWLSNDHFLDRYRWNCDRLAKIIQFLHRLLEQSDLWNANVQWDNRWTLYVRSSDPDDASQVYASGQVLNVSHSTEIDTVIQKIAADLVAPALRKPIVASKPSNHSHPETSK